MSFVDTLLAHHHCDSIGAVSVVMVDPHSEPGGQWHDSYDFVRLHQPSSMYGVETERLEPVPSPEDGTTTSTTTTKEQEEHRATRKEILQYYQKVQQKLETNYSFYFVGGAMFDLKQISSALGTTSNGTGSYMLDLLQSEDPQKPAQKHSIKVLKRVVDARFLEPDLPVAVPPKFSFDPNVIQCVPVNALVSMQQQQQQSSYQHYVIVGGGKTGMDAVTYLLTVQNVKPEDILWVVPNDVWITARENIGSCIEFLHTSAEIAEQGTENDNLEKLVQSPQFLQNGFLEWERSGKIYRLHADDSNDIPQKFKDATLSKDEVQLLQQVPVLRRQGRIQAIASNGDLILTNKNTVVPLPWRKKHGNDNCSQEDLVVNKTVFIHCSAGAFNYTKHPQIPPPPIFAPGRIILQDVYGTPGFCFVGSILAMIECQSQLSDEEKNRLCLSPQPTTDEAKNQDPLGPSGGDITGLSMENGLVQRLLNLKHWLALPKVRPWLFTNRLFNLKHLTPEQAESMVQDIEQVLIKGGVLSS